MRRQTLTYYKVGRARMSGKEMSERQCFRCDEDGHWYLINLSDANEFDKLLYDDKDECCIAFEEKFSKCRLSMHITCYSFVDCEEK